MQFSQFAGLPAVFVLSELFGETMVPYSAICMFQSAAVDSKRSSVDRAKFRGMMDKLSSTSFLMDLALMKDALRELSCLSLRLQSRSTTVVISSANVRLRVFQVEMGR